VVRLEGSDSRVGLLVNPRFTSCLRGLFSPCGHHITHHTCRRRHLRGLHRFVYAGKRNLAVTHGGRVKRHLPSILADLLGGHHVYELGSGWGTLALPIATHFSSSQVTGYENSIVPFLASKLRLTISSAKNLELRWANFFKVDLSDATLIVCYQSPGTMSNLRPKFEAELPDSTYVVSNTFAIPGWNPTETYRVDNLFKTRIYVYRVGNAKPLRPS
jgi:hypothetical protein